MVVHIEGVHGIGLGKTLVAFDDEQVLVVFVRRFESEILTSRCDDAICRQRVDDHHLVAPDGCTDLQHLFRARCECPLNRT
jgi:hypothetical protein